MVRRFDGSKEDVPLAVLAPKMTLELELIQHGALSLALPVSLSHSLSLLPSLPVVVSRIVTHTHTFSLSYGGCSPTLPQHAWGSQAGVSKPGVSAQAVRVGEHPP